MAKSIGGLVENAAASSERVIDAFGGTGAYIHYLRDCGIDKPMIYNEFDPYRYITIKQLRDNPIGVRISAQYYLGKLTSMLSRFKDNDIFGSDAKATQQTIRDFFQSEAERLIEPGQDYIELNKNGLPVRMKNTPEVAGLYLVMQNQRYGYRPIQADASLSGLKKTMRSAEVETLSKRKNKILLLGRGRNYLSNLESRISAIHRRLSNVEVLRGDGWKLIRDGAGKGDFVPVDTSYLGKEISNYNKSTREDCNAEIYVKKVHKYLVPAMKRQAKLLITNNWDYDVLKNLRRLGLSVFKVHRSKGVSRETAELVAINFNPTSGTIDA